MAASKTIWDLAPFARLIDAQTCNVRTVPPPPLGRGQPVATPAGRRGSHGSDPGAPRSGDPRPI